MHQAEGTACTKSNEKEAHSGSRGWKKMIPVATETMKGGSEKGSQDSLSGTVAQKMFYFPGPRLKSLLRSMAGIRGFDLFKKERTRSIFSTNSYLFLRSGTKKTD